MINGLAWVGACVVAAAVGALLFHCGAPDWLGRGIAIGGAIAASRVIWGSQ